MYWQSSQYYDPGMEELSQAKVLLPERTEAIPFPKIRIDLDIKNDPHWKLTNGYKVNTS